MQSVDATRPRSGGAGEYPETIVEAAAIEHFDQHLPVLAVEKPEETRVVGAEGDDPGRAGGALKVLPLELDLEPIVVQAEGRQARGTRLARTAAATTNVGYRLVVTDTESGQVRTYSNPLGVSSPAITDAGAFATCP